MTSIKAKNPDLKILFHILDDTNKKCIYKDNAYKKEYQNFYIYNNNHGSISIDEIFAKLSH